MVNVVTISNKLGHNIPLNQVGIFYTFLDFTVSLRLER
jgi:hypothetical protein